MNSDFLDLLRLLNANKVKYLVIGGYAVSLHGEPRYTKDLDIWVEATMANSKKTLKALKHFGAPIDNLTVEDLAKPGLVYIFGIPPVRVDILNQVKGLKFESAYAKRVTFHINKIAVHVVSILDLIKTKKAVGRPQDKADVSKLLPFLRGRKAEI